MLRDPIELGASERSPATAQAAMVEALVAGEGLPRVAAIAEEHVGAPVAVLVPRPGSDGAGGTAAERYVAELVAGGDPGLPEEVRELAPVVSAGEVHGAVVMLGDGSPDAAEYLSAAAVAALTGIAMLNARDETARGLESSLIADLLGQRQVGAVEVVRRASLLDCNLRGGATALCAEPLEGPAGHLAAEILAERPDCLAESVGGRVYALLPDRTEAAERLADRLAGHATVAVSSHYPRPAAAQVALEEAQLLLEVGAAAGPSGRERAASTAFRLLHRLFVNDPDEVRRFSERTIGPVVRHDERYETELLLTLCKYQLHNCNMNTTARATYTHRHTVANRLARIRELTGLDPLRSEDRQLLNLALKARRIVERRPAG